MLPAQSNLSILEAGLDEVGRGCLAGPVVAAAVILPHNFKHHLLVDSKTLSKAKLSEAATIIKANAIAFSVGICSVAIIDQINILKASINAMHQAVQGLNMVPEALLVDGNRFYPYPNIPHTCVIKGDTKYGNIAAASIIAKVYRDSLMASLHLDYPQYGWSTNVGYPTKYHKAALLQYGICQHHRVTFKGVKELVF